jgi:sugar-phosphatase
LQQCGAPGLQVRECKRKAVYNRIMALSITSSPVQIRCKGVLFDMDGILISSLGIVERTWTKWALIRGMDPEQVLNVIHGRRALDSMILLRPDLDPKVEMKILEDIEVQDSDGLRMLPGVLELLAALPKDRWTVVTSATERVARVRLAAGGIPVPDYIVKAESVTQGKPHPAPYLAGAALLGFAPDQCVVFEDSSSGVKAGHDAGCIVIATTFSHQADSLEAADYLVEDVTGVAVEVLAGGQGLVLKFTPLAG